MKFLISNGRVTWCKGTVPQFRHSKFNFLALTFLSYMTLAKLFMVMAPESKTSEVKKIPLCPFSL